MTDDQKHYPWNEGQSTKPDVDALMKTFPVDTLVIGARFADSEIRAAIGICTGTRYRTVYSAWVRRLHADHGINMFREKQVGFYVPTFAEVVAQTHPAIQHMGRTAKKQTKRLAVAKPENDLERGLQDHQGRLLHALHRETKKARMNTLPSMAIPEPVRIQAPVGK